ncbi:AsmA-like C-terminal region-containing protein [Hydrogenophaga sp.]|uniref:AsmA-like C-terminal region-containing protein n=1 Tax=Hydrogenophaga sp. TaxID=1904254 RepID=UPI00262619CB|nr:AsmA-like C-terminal region-containing protein [Hydrogenophaga sp.]
MTHTHRWSIAAVAVVTLMSAACLVVWALMPSDEELARRLETEFEAKLGEKLSVGQVHWRLLGLPVVEVLDAHTEQSEAISVRRVAIYPELLPLLSKRLVIKRLQVDGAVVPRKAVAAFRNKGLEGMGSVLLRAVSFSDTTYISYSGIPVVYEGEIRWDEDGLPLNLQVRLPDAETPASIEALRDGVTESGGIRYQMRLQGGGGSANGQVQLTTGSDGRYVLKGELAPHAVEVSALLTAFHRRSPISGLASGQTVLSAEGSSLNELLRSLNTRSVLKVERAKILRFDWEKAVRSVGKDHGGETPLQSLSGVVETQNTEQGMKSEFTRLRAVAGSYSATGKATLYRRQISAQGRVEVGDGVIEVPFTANGPTRDPDFQIGWSTLAGAVIGTAVLPGIGTVLGAKIGGMLKGPPDRVGKHAPSPQR